MIFPGDIILAIDDVDTQAMSSNAIMKLMVSTANAPRQLTVLSERRDGEYYMSHDDYSYSLQDGLW
jgi:C-terminal processing protease CtpA/Prc